MQPGRSLDKCSLAAACLLPAVHSVLAARPSSLRSLRIGGGTTIGGRLELLYPPVPAHRGTDYNRGPPRAPGAGGPMAEGTSTGARTGNARETLPRGRAGGGVPRRPRVGRREGRRRAPGGRGQRVGPGAPAKTDGRGHCDPTSGLRHLAQHRRHCRNRCGSSSPREQENLPSGGNRISGESSWH